MNDLLGHTYKHICLKTSCPSIKINLEIMSSSRFNILKELYTGVVFLGHISWNWVAKVMVKNECWCTQIRNGLLWPSVENTGTANRPR